MEVLERRLSQEGFQNMIVHTSKPLLTETCLLSHGGGSGSSRPRDDHGARAGGRRTCNCVGTFCRRPFGAWHGPLLSKGGNGRANATVRWLPVVTGTQGSPALFHLGRRSHHHISKGHVEDSPRQRTGVLHGRGGRTKGGSAGESLVDGVES